MQYLISPIESAERAIQSTVDKDDERHNEWSLLNKHAVNSNFFPT